MLGDEFSWVTSAFAGGLTFGGLAVVFRLLTSASNFASSRYRELAQHQGVRVDDLERDMEALRVKVRDLEEEVEAQRKVKHDWKNLAASLLMERDVIRAYARQAEALTIISLMDELDAKRAVNPLLNPLSLEEEP